MGEEDRLFNLRWDAQRSALLGSVASLYREEAFVDTTVVADNKIFKAHKLLLSASSPYLRLILESVPSSQHAVLFMPHIGSSDLGNVLKFIYDGEIKINRRSLKSFLSVARLLRIKGMDFELDEDLEVNIPPGSYVNSHCTSASTSILSPSVVTSHGHNKSPTSTATATATDLTVPSVNASNNHSSNDDANVTANDIPSAPRNMSMSSSPSSLSGGSSSSQVKHSSSSQQLNMKHEVMMNRSSSPTIKDDAQPCNSVAQNNNNNVNGSPNATMNGSCGKNTDEEVRVSRPAPISSSGRSTDSVSSPVSNSAHSPRDRESIPPLISSNNNNHADEISHSAARSEIEGSVLEDSNHSERSLIDNRKALNLHIGHRYHHNDHNDNESIDMDHDSRPTTDDRDEPGIPIPDHDMDDDYDDDDDDDAHFSMSIQPEVSLRESDESYSIHDRRLQQMQLTPTNFSNSLNNLSLLGNSSMSITPTPGGGGAPGSSSSAHSPLTIQQQMTLRHLSKLARPMIPKAHHHLPGQGSPHSGLSGQMPGISEGILMRMMREPLQGGSSKPLGSSSSHGGGFFDIPHGDPNLHPSGLRKQKRYVQCTSCSKVLSSLSALKRHMEDVHCARIQGKCLLCGRVYSSRNSLLTHVYSAHKKHHDYKAVARIIRESDFEQFATA